MTELAQGNYSDARKNLQEAYIHFCNSLGADDEKSKECEILYGREIYLKAISKLKEGNIQ